MKNGFFLIGGIFSLVLSSHASLFFTDDFSTFSPGNLVAQQGWSQFGSATASPQQVGASGLLFPGGQTTDGQDAIKNFGIVSAPVSGTISLYQGLSLTIGSLPPAVNPYWFTALQDVSAGFSNIRLTALDQSASPGYYRLGARVTGQSGAPWAFGAYDLAYGSQHRVIIEANMVAGAQNDFVRVFVDPTSLDLSSQIPYLVASVVSGGNVTDPTGLGALLLSQFGTLSQPSLDAVIARAAVGDSFSDVANAIGVVPEPATCVLFALGLLAWNTLRRRS